MQIPGPARKFDVMIACDTCCDLMMTGNVRPQFKQIEQLVGDYSLEMGGSATIFGSQLGKLGLRVGAIGWVGQDSFGRYIVEQLQLAGLDTMRIRTHASVKTGLGVLLSEQNDRAILTYLGTIDATHPSDLDKNVLDSCRHWHVASYFLMKSLRDFWPEWLRECREHGVTVSLDTNWDPENRWQGVTDLLPYVDIFLPNKNEALAITGKKSALEAADELARHCPFVIIKQGEKGVLARKGNETWELRPGPDTGLPETVVDSTGAGDNFDAGFLAAYLAGEAIPDCLLLGHRCAVSSLAHLGGVRGQLWKEHVARLAATPRYVK